MKFAEINSTVEGAAREYQWEGESHWPIKIDYFVHDYVHKPIPPYPWPVKIVAKNVHWFPPYVVAVRTDVQPFWWIAVAVQYRFERLLKRFNRDALEAACLLNMLDLERGVRPHWGQLKFLPSRWPKPKPKP